MINTELIDVIRTLRKESKKRDQPVWKALADDLDKPKRRRTVVNLSRINRNTEADEIIAVPGKILGSGWLNHPLTVAAYKFSDMASEKIKMADGKAIKLTDLLKKDVDTSKIKIMK